MHRTQAAPGGLPVHPHTGLTALGIVGGRPVWPVMGGSQPTGGEPAPGALNPATAPTGTPTAPPAPTPTPTPTPGPDPSTPVDVDSLPANVQKMIRDLRTENGHRRTTAQQAEQRLAAVLKAAGLNPDGTKVEDPAAAAAQLAERAEQAESAAWRNAIELQVVRLAGPLGADPDRLLDSMAFIDSLDDLAEDDKLVLGSPEFRAAVEAKVREAVTKNPARYKAGNAAPTPPRSGGDFTGGPPGAQPITEEQLAQMSPAEIAKAYNEGRLKHLM
jgi:uncharacterized membrane protein